MLESVRVQSAPLDRYSITDDYHWQSFSMLYLKKVCGSDGETYDNICVLRSRGSNVRLDYFGECLNEEGVSTEEACDRVMKRQLCKFNSDNCRSLIQPADGCCPVCGKQKSSKQILLKVLCRGSLSVS